MYFIILTTSFIGMLTVDVILKAILSFWGDSAVVVSFYLQKQVKFILYQSEVESIFTVRRKFLTREICNLHKYSI